VVSEAKPIIGDYHFTTIIPVLGVVTMGPESSFVMADIPGLIEGASDGVGLGHEFLRHVERCSMLVHIVDVAGSEGRDPKADFEAINRELERFNPELAKCPQIVAGNKIDLATDAQREDFRKYIEDKGLEYHEIIAPIAYGTKELIDSVAKMLSTLPPVKRYETEQVPPEIAFRTQPDNSFSVTQLDDRFVVEAEWLGKILARVNPDDYESLEYFQRVLETSGILRALREKGIQQGDTVSIYDLEFEYVE
jgi:GTP-binding protein